MKNNMTAGAIKLDEAVKIVVNFIKNTRSNKMFVLIKGGLGSGKTTFVKNVLKEFTKEMVVSPTFSYMSKYDLNNLAVANVHHIDMYKFTHKESKDQEAINFITSTVENDSGLFFVEWPTEPIVFAAIEIGNVLYINIKNEFKCTLSLIMAKRMTKAIEFEERPGDRRDFNRDRGPRSGGREGGSWERRDNRGGDKRDFNRDRGPRSGGRDGGSWERRDNRGGDRRDFNRDRGPRSGGREGGSWERRDNRGGDKRDFGRDRSPRSGGREGGSWEKRDNRGGDRRDFNRDRGPRSGGREGGSWERRDNRGGDRRDFNRDRGPRSGGREGGSWERRDNRGGDRRDFGRDRSPRSGGRDSGDRRDFGRDARGKRPETDYRKSSFRDGNRSPSGDVAKPREAAVTHVKVTKETDSKKSEKKED